MRPRNCGWTVTVAYTLMPACPLTWTGVHPAGTAPMPVYLPTNAVATSQAPGASSTVPDRRAATLRSLAPARAACCATSAARSRALIAMPPSTRRPASSTTTGVNRTTNRVSVPRSPRHLRPPLRHMGLSSHRECVDWGRRVTCNRLGLKPDERQCRQPDAAGDNDVHHAAGGQVRPAAEGHCRGVGALARADEVAVGGRPRIAQRG